MSDRLTRSQFGILEALEASGHVREEAYDAQDLEALRELGLITYVGGGKIT